MAGTVYSNCSTITTGCFLYNNSNLTSPVSNGKYSDGNTCYTVSGGNGEITAAGSCSENVYFNINGPDSADSLGQASPIQLASQSVNTYVDGSYINLQTTVTAYCGCFGVDNTIYGYIAITTGNHCNTTSTFNGLNSNEVIDGYGVVSVDVASYGTQTYFAGSGFRNSTYNC